MARISQPAFAFLIHPRSREEALQHRMVALLRDFSSCDDECIAKLRGVPPLVIGEVRFGFSPIWGELVCIPLLPEEMLTPQGKRLVVEGFLVAARRGVRVVGLGALTAPASGGGLTLTRHCPPGLTITNGNAFTAGVIAATVHRCAEDRGATSAPVAVVGSTGSVGAALCALLADDGFPLTLIGRSAQRARSLYAHERTDVRFAGDLSPLREAAIVVLLTSDTTAQIAPEYCAPGAVVLDCAQPPNVAPAARGRFRERSVTVIDGGVVRIPGYTSSYAFCGDPTATYACLAETVLFAREGVRAHSVGRASPELARRVQAMARRHDIFPVQP